ncbi:MAG TPA: NADH-quinone oxidoreductase subunit L [Anaerolineales bacterium]|nr:NADH-quinone oxidoreductase subunit L [Anaerolineales bacterium]
MAFSSLAPLIFVFPIAGLLINLAFGKKLGEGWVSIVAVGAVALSFVIALTQAIGLASSGFQTQIVHLADWIHIGSLNIPWEMRIDTLSVTFMLLVSGVGSLIHLFATGYMHGDERFPRFFVYLNLFIVAMMFLVTGNNYLILFLGWEGVGVCSYLLIGFWFDRGAGGVGNANAARKAFITNRVGDFGMVLAMSLIFWTTHSLTYDNVIHAAETGVITAGVATLIALLLLLGVSGKSAQVPLYIWLPDAMAGPTPVSALIHAATMVTAGLYLITRSAAIFNLAPTAQMVVAIVGAVTAFIAGTIAVAQWDIKRVLAFSTISQLGFMVAVAGLGGYVAVIFHLLTHAFFKALLFLSSGSVIHGMEHGHHHLHEHGHGHDDHGHDAHAHHHEEKPFDPQDMRFMGNLRSKMPVTFWVYLIGSLALAGIFPLAGFWSKDEILADAFQKGLEGAWHAWLVYGLLTIGALFTAFYMTRQVMLVFFGKARHEAAKHAHESAPVMLIPLIVLAVLSVFGGMLNLPGGIQGVEGVHLPLSEGLVNWLGHTQIDYTQRPDLLAPAEMDAHSTHGETTDAHAPAEGTHATEGETATGHTAEGGEHEGGHHAWYHGLDLNPMVAGLSTLIGLLAIFAGYSLYKNGLASAFAPDPLKKIIGVGLFTFLENKWYVDEFYAWLIINPFKNLSVWLAEVIDWDFFHDLFHDGIIASGFAGIANLLAGPVDKGFVDKVFDGAAGMVRGIGGWGTRTFQTGYVRNYALSVLFGVVLLLAYAVYALLT